MVEETKGNATAKTNEAAQAAQRAPRPPGPPKNAQEAAANLAQLRNNPQAMGVLQQLLGGGAGPQGAPGVPQGQGMQPPTSGQPMAGQDVLFAAIANCVNGISFQAQRTIVDLEDERKKNAKLELELAGFRKQQEAESIVKQGENVAKRTASRVLEKALAIASAHGGNAALSEAMIALAQESGIELNSDHIEALEGKLDWETEGKGEDDAR